MILVTKHVLLVEVLTSNRCLNLLLLMPNFCISFLSLNKITVSYFRSLLSILKVENFQNCKKVKHTIHVLTDT